MEQEILPKLFRDCAKRVIQQFHYVATPREGFAGLQVAQVTGLGEYVNIVFEDGTQETRFGLQLAILG